MDSTSYFAAYWKQRFNPAAFQRRVNTLHKNYATRLPADRDARIVEVGPGFGEMLEYLAKSGYAATTALDNDGTLVAALRARGISSVCHVGDTIRWLNEHPEQFDCTIALHVLEHFDAAAGAQLLQAMFRALAPGGTIIIEVPNMANFITAPYARWADYTHRHGYTQESLSAALRAAGFEVAECFGVRRAIRSTMELIAYSAQRVTDAIAWLLVKANYPQARIITAPAIAVVGRRPAAAAVHT
jgi:O-antigen chain-terminating methyltransferase